MEFIRKEDLQLIKGGFVSDKEGKPVCNNNFIEAQRKAHWYALLAKEAKGKTFKQSPISSKEDLFKAVHNKVKTSKLNVYKKEKSIKKPLTEQLKTEALNFINAEQNNSKTRKINVFMQDFNVLKDFEDFGLFFEEGVCKLDRIYTIKEILGFMETLIEIL